MECTQQMENFSTRRLIIDLLFLELMDSIRILTISILLISLILSPKFNLNVCSKIE